MKDSGVEFFGATLNRFKSLRLGRGIWLLQQPSYSATPAGFHEDQRKIVRRHLLNVAQLKPVGSGLTHQCVYVTNAPSRGPPLEVCIEGGVGSRRVRAAHHEGPIEEEDPVRPQETARACKEPK